MHTDKSVLDPCCGARKFYFNKEASCVLYGDIRDETYVQCDGRRLEVHPDMQMDFTALAFPNEHFALVFYDPPHLKYAGTDSFMRQAYGALPPDDPIGYVVKGFTECWRVLRHEGTLIFKWNEDQIALGDLLSRLPVQPLIGNRRPKGARGQTFWMVFFKD